MKLKRRGYILFIYWSGEKPHFETGEEFCDTKKELMSRYHCHWDDKWDMVGRNKLHYFYFDVGKNKYYSLPKWKDDVDKSDRFNSSDTKVISTKTF